jgi:hypothetical protein
VGYFLVVLAELDLHVVHEEGVVRPGRDYANLDAVLRVPVQELVVHEHLQCKRVRPCN